MLYGLALLCCSFPLFSVIYVHLSIFFLSLLSSLHLYPLYVLIHCLFPLLCRCSSPDGDHSWNPHVPHDQRNLEDTGGQPVVAMFLMHT